MWLSEGVFQRQTRVTLFRALITMCRWRDPYCYVHMAAIGGRHLRARRADAPPPLGPAPLLLLRVRGGPCKARRGGLTGSPSGIDLESRASRP